MNSELERLRALAAVIATAEAALDMAYRTLQESAAGLLRIRDATLAEVSEATGLNQGDLLEMLSQNFPGRELS
ncbi:hypothetical protein QFZ79_001517 [Arthrobacter sp. V4I6]|uniref:hypothetical protein n=1 Tax=unclassified Arthrobacter TaxID=235627 RepID=UPI00277E2051|nr:MULTISPECIES: hypothetical protein [unclassified Arthrobacter]MDQ0819222.1 hypothetical protein [Arthrobacter sp. V1I7]MDQ0853406.1 hypothetical protein [Arthrobacter sp. V4I6]